MSKSSEELYKKRQKRINDAIGLKKAYIVRVPIMVLFNFFLAWHSCMTRSHRWKLLHPTR